MAGFGTAGSLLAGAAILFVFASALVSFRGWPGDSVQSRPVAVVPARTPSGSPQLRRVALVAAAQLRAPAPARAAAAPRPATLAGPALVLGGPGAAVVVPLAHAPDTRVIPPRIATVTAPAGGSAGSAPCTTGGCIVHKVGSTLGTTASTAGSTVSATGNSLGSAVTAVGSALGSSVSGLSPVLGKTVSGATGVLGGTLTNATAALGSTLAGAGRRLGALLSGQR